MAASQQQKVDNQPLAFSLKAVVYPWECLSLGMWKQGFGDRMFFLKNWSQLARIREETLESGNLFSSWLVEFCLRTVYKIQLIVPMWNFFSKQFSKQVLCIDTELITNVHLVKRYFRTLLITVQFVFRRSTWTNLQWNGKSIFRTSCSNQWSAIFIYLFFSNDSY